MTSTSTTLAIARKLMQQERAETDGQRVKRLRPLPTPDQAPAAVPNASIDIRRKRLLGGIVNEYHRAA